MYEPYERAGRGVCPGETAVLTLGAIIGAAVEAPRAPDPTARMASLPVQEVTRRTQGSPAAATWGFQFVNPSSQS